MDDILRAESNEINRCAFCWTLDNLMLCAACKDAWYCSKQHQKTHWKIHKIECKKKSGPKVPASDTICVNANSSQEKSLIRNRLVENSVIDFDMSGFSTYKESSSFLESFDGSLPIMPPNSEIKSGSPDSGKKGKMVPNGGKSDIRGASQVQPDQREVKIADYVVKCLNDYGICVVDNFMSGEKCQKILEEVHGLDDSGIMKDGQLSSKINAGKKIRGDKIAWVERGEQGCPQISDLIQRLDSLILTCNGRLGRYTINGRTKSMVACYPGNGTQYLRHVDNPNEDGRCVTSIYYLNKDWDLTKDGGLLRIYPAKFTQVADIEPKFDRLLFFWSDRRNPHEVQPAYRARYAITVWYFDAEERLRARLKHQTQLDDHSFNNNEPHSQLT